MTVSGDVKSLVAPARCVGVNYVAGDSEWYSQRLRPSSYGITVLSLTFKQRGGGAGPARGLSAAALVDI